MITRDQVTSIIAEATAKHFEPPELDENAKFAYRLATALDALGLIQFCDISEPDTNLPTAEDVRGILKAEHNEHRNRLGEDDWHKNIGRDQSADHQHNPNPDHHSGG